MDGWLSTLVDKVYFRQQPGLTGEPIQTLDKGTELYWTGERSGQTDAIAIQGVKKRLPWLKVKSEFDQVGWVYQGCVQPYLLRFLGDVVADTLKIWDSGFACLERVDGTAFQTFLKNRLVSGIAPDPEGDVPEETRADTASLKLSLEHRDTIFRNMLHNGEGYTEYRLIKSAKDWHILSGAYWEWGDIIFLHKKDGKTYHSLGSGTAPVVSPDGKQWAFLSSQGYGDNYNSGIEVFDAGKGRFLSIQIGRFMETQPNLEALLWEDDLRILFKTRENTYFRLTFPPG